MAEVERSRLGRPGSDADAGFRTNDFSKTADNALRLLALISESGPIPTGQLAERSSLHRSVVRRLVYTLQSHGLIWSTPSGYVVGSSVLALAERVAPQLQAVMRPLMRSLADEVGETVLCTIRRGADAILLCQERGLRHLIRVEDEPGARHSIYLGASGPALLSLLDDAEIADCLSDATEDERARAREHVASVRSHGYCHSSGERQRGVAAIAAPVASPTGEPLCSLGVIVPEIRDEELPGLVPHLVEYARRAEGLVSGDVLGNRDVSAS
jgi:DNA-binding IclR family transcriptional regulator